MQIKPPSKSKSVEALEDLKRRFIEGDDDGSVIAEVKNISPSYKFPWEDSDLKESRNVNYPLRLSEVMHAKIKYLSTKTSIPMSKLLNQVIEPWINKKILESIKDETSNNAM